MPNTDQQVKNDGEMDVKRYTFLIEEYKTLREEIKATKDRIFKIASLSAAGIPYSYIFAKDNDFEIIRIFLPLLVLGVALLYISENISLMRCGKYIKNCIEPVVVQAICSNENIFNKWKGWEHSLAEMDDSGFMKNPERTAERIAASFFYIFFIVHYIVSVVLSVKTIHEKYGSIICCVSIISWLIIGLLFAAYLRIIFKKSISTTN